ncbi:carbon monoxide dehydrogenase subunit G [uncultured Rhodoblastus sp.]|uniref:SRPBCC family protein n=1 Tax=uncultured Rhodoblastus sp. TaxID=543037 RepID=UPI0025FE754F|nr:carbon monoxide dehydrogenase subunit G [uncultured Rhodoblastus sp.]
MDMNDSQRIEAPRDAVWNALNDPEVLRQCIPGCESIEKLSDTELEAASTLRVGPIKASFKGKVMLSDIDPPNGYKISGEGSGGLAGHAKGGAKVGLVADGAATILNYEVKAEVGGKIAQLGGRLIDATAKKLAGEFFEKFGAIVAAGHAPEAAVAVPAKAGWWAALRAWLGRWFRKASPAMLLVFGLSIPTCCLDGSHHRAGEMPFPICTAQS